MPRVLTPDDEQELKTLRAFFDPQKSADRLDSYGKWIFTVIASITALGTGLSNSAFQNLDSHGKLVYGFAVVLGGISLASAALLLTPQLSGVNRWSMDSMYAAIDHVNRNRRAYVIFASWSLALAFILAAVAPLVSSHYTPRVIVPSDPDIQYSLVGNKLTVTIGLAGLLPNSQLSVDLKRVAPEPQSLLGRAVISASDKGTAKTTIETTLAAGGRLRIEYAAVGGNGTPKTGTQEFVCEIGPR